MLSKTHFQILHIFPFSFIHSAIQEGRTGNTPLLISLMSRNWDIANFLLERNAHVNIPNYSNFFPLHFAVQGNHEELVKNLLKRGAEMGSRTNDYDSTNDSAEKVNNLFLTSSSILSWKHQ